MKCRTFVAVPFAWFLITPAWGESNANVQVIISNRGLVEASAEVPGSSGLGKVTIPTKAANSERITRRINDPDNLIFEANKISAELPAKVLAKEMGKGTIQTDSLGPESLNEFSYRSQILVSDDIAAREDYKMVAAAFKEARAAFDIAHTAFREDRKGDFYNAREALTEKLVQTLLLIERLYGNIREKPTRSAVDKDTQAHFVRHADMLRSDLFKLRGMLGSSSDETVESIDKAIYGFDDNFEIFQVDQIYRDAPAIVMIRDSKQPGTPIGTAFLIGKNTIVTAEHCVMENRNKETLGDLEFVFFNEFEFDKARMRHIKREEIVCTFKGNAKYGMDLDVGESFGAPDFAVLEISPPDEKKEIIEGITPLTISLRRATYADALCSIGHPRGNQKQVHLNCRVLLPFELKGKQDIDSFSTKLAARIGRIDSIRNQPQGKGPSPSDRERALIGELYTRDLSESDNSNSIYHVDRTNGLNRPAIAIEADTFPGDSGAPIIDIRTNAVIGILVAGQPTSNATIKEVSLEKHEIALPIKFVVNGIGGGDAVRAIGGNIIEK